MSENTSSLKQDINKGLIALLFIIILLLLGGLIAITIFTNDQTKQYEKQLSGLKEEIALQKSEKNTIRGVWQNQAAENDKLIRSQDNLLSSLDLYQKEIANSFRFVDGKAQILPTINENKLKTVTSDLNTEIKSLEETTKENANSKEKNKTIIDNLYISSGEAQPNTAK
jgi:hypothetical protein